MNGPIGGTGLLFARTCSLLAQRRGYELHLVDYKDGGVARYLRDKQVPFVHVVQDAEEAPIGGSYDYILTNLLSSKSLQARLVGNEQARLFLWMTFPADAYKWLPLSTLLNGMPLWWRRLIAFAHRRQSARIGKTLAHGMRARGIALMDEACWKFSRELFDIDGTPNIVPICSGEATGLVNRRPSSRRPEVCWVGRLTDFKTAALDNALAAFSRHADECPVGTIHIVGDGDDRTKLEKAARERHARLQVVFHGHLPPAQMRQLLSDHADIFIGHGTSLLEAAQLGIPSLLVDPSYVSVSPDKFRADWFTHQEGGNVGRMIQSAEEYVGSAWPALYAEYMADPVGLGARCHAHWDRTHNPERVSEMVHAQLLAGTYTLSDFRSDGGALPDAGGRVIERFKSWVKSRRK